MGVRVGTEMEGESTSFKQENSAGHPTFQASPLGPHPQVIIMTSGDMLLDDPSLQMATPRFKRRGLLCCVGLWLGGIATTLLVGFGLLALLVYLIIHPQLPMYNVQMFELHNLPNQTLTAVDLEPRTYLSALIQSRNPNWKAGIIFENSTVSVQSDGMTITSTAIPRFYQSPKNTTVLKADLSLRKWATNLLVDKKKDLRNWPISVNLDGSARLKVGWLRAKNFKLRARCILNVDVISSPQKINDGWCRVYA